MYIQYTCNACYVKCTTVIFRCFGSTVKINFQTHKSILKWQTAIVRIISICEKYFQYDILLCSDPYKTDQNRISCPKCTRIIIRSRQHSAVDAVFNEYRIDFDPSNKYVVLCSCFEKFLHLYRYDIVNDTKKKNAQILMRLTNLLEFIFTLK